MESWILFTLLAVVMQSVRTAGQKHIARNISFAAATLVRFLFGLPFAVLYFAWLAWYFREDTLAPGATFYVSASLAAVAQIVATFCLVKAMSLRNFAVGTAMAKTEALLTAVLGSWLFAESLTLLGYIAVVVGVTGVLVASQWKVTRRDLLENPAITYGIGAGLGFALASLLLRDASLSLAVSRLYSAAAVLIYMVSLQTVICLAWVATTERQQFALIKGNLRASVFIGFTGIAGSIGWFTAMSLQKAALVKTLGQTEFVVTLLLSYLYFQERISAREYLGIILVALSLLLLFAA